MKKRILIIDPATIIGGAERFTADMMNHVSPGSFEIHIATSNSEKYPKLFVQSEITFHTMEMPSLKPITPRNIMKLIQTRKKLDALVRELKPDIIISNVVRSHILISPIARKYEIPLIWMFPDDTFPRWALRRYVDIPVKLLPCSQFIKDWILKQTSGRYAEKIEVMYNGVENMTMIERKSHPHPVIGIVSRIVPWKGQEYFLMAAREVLKKIPNAKFEIIGQVDNKMESTDFLKKLEWRIKEWNLGKSVTILTDVKDISKKFCELDLFVHASIHPEPFGRVIIEAMNAGVPVIASSLGGPREIIDDGVDGLLVDPRQTGKLAEAMIKIISNPKLSELLVQNAFDTLKAKFSLSIITKRYEKIIQET